MVLCTSYLCIRNVDGVTHYCCMLYIIILMHMYRLQNCYYPETLSIIRTTIPVVTFTFMLCVCR